MEKFEIERMELMEKEFSGRDRVEKMIGIPCKNN